MAASPTCCTDDRLLSRPPARRWRMPFHRAQRANVALGAALLDEANRPVEQNDREDGAGIGRLTESGGDNAAGCGEPDERAVELTREVPPLWNGGRLHDDVRAGRADATIRLGGCEPGRRAGHVRIP